MMKHAIGWAFKRALATWGVALVVLIILAYLMRSAEPSWVHWYEISLK